jgi:uncharacterized OB-fold protein
MASVDSVPVHEGLFTVADDGSPRLITGRCQSCGRHHFPRAGTCQYCGSDGVDETLLAGEGTLWAWTAVTAPPPGYRGEVPYGFGVVELPVGLRVLTRLTEPDPSRLRFGQDVRLRLVPLHVDDAGRPVLTWAFG